MSRERILGIPFFTGSVDEAVREALRGGLVVAPSGPNLANELRSVPDYRRAVESADVALTDSAVMVAVYRAATGKSVPRHSGLKFLEAILAEPALKESGAAFWVMPTEEEGRKIADWLRTQGFPLDETNTYVAPFYRGYPIKDKELLRRLRSAKPRVVFLNLAGGKQEVLGAWLRERLDPCPGIVCTGAAVAFLAGTQAKIPVWADRSGLGWLMRCIYEPRKFIPRYWSALPLIGLVLKYRDRCPSPKPQRGEAGPMRANAPGERGFLLFGLENFIRKGVDRCLSVNSPMLTKVYSAALHGADAREVEIEVNEGSGDPKVLIVGLPDAAVKESKDRVTTAMANSGYRWPRGRTTINLAPADIKKEGPSFDLPIAIGMLAIAHGRDLPRLADCAITGELALTGAIRPVKGVLPIAIEARRRGKKALLVPVENAAEASVVQGLAVFGVRNLRECFEFLDGQKAVERTESDLDTVFRSNQRDELDFADVKGQSSVKRAFEVAVAGGHNLLVIGAPGAGKSMLAKRIPGIMPPMTLEEAIETTKIHSVCGLLDGKHNFVAIRPFRSPHHTISDVGLLGGSTNPTPGEVSLAHHGVLFLDELPEFKRSTLEVMRQPLEDGKVTISRAAGSLTFPADIMLVAAMNPCPCGFYGHPKRECRCSPGQVERYRQRVSGPLLDRIDIHVEAPPVEYAELTSTAAEESSSVVRARVESVRARQAKRFGSGLKPALNARMTPKLMREHCAISETCHNLMKHALDDLHLSARAHDRILKVARTIADLAYADSIGEEHLLEAIQYRTLDRSLWM